MEVLRLENVTFTYAQTDKPSVEQVHLQVNEGEFVVLCGASGSGKSTLLKLLKRELTPKGMLSGDIQFYGQSMATIEEQQLVEQIAIVMQDPDYQIVFDDTMQEFVFALENIGLPAQEMKKRIAELVHYFSAQALLEQQPSRMSGGQKQTVNLLSALLLKPKLLLLDEPTAQLDPIAAKKFVAMLKQLNEETGMTIIMVEHQTEQLFEVADKMVLLEQGKVILSGTAQQFAKRLLTTPYQLFVPETVRFLHEQQRLIDDVLPFNLKDSKRLLSGVTLPSAMKYRDVELTSAAIHCTELYAQYAKNAPFTLKNFSLTVNEGEIFALLGSNGSGKSTWLKTLIGELAVVRGRMSLFGKKKLTYKEQIEQLRYLPQNPKMYFTHDSIEAEMQALVQQYGVDDSCMEQLLHDYDIAHLRHRHPHDCSGGELQRAALACLQIGRPKILLLDEPTKGLDPLHKQQLIELLQRLQQTMTIVCVTHDVQFAAQCASRCGILFNGEVTVSGSVDDVLKANYFYTTALNRLTKTAQFDGYLTIQEATAAYAKINH